MSVSRKDFRIIAAEISNISDKAVRIEAAMTAARACASLNPRFKLDVFLKACGV
jgi:hypothetical protein